MSSIRFALEKLDNAVSRLDLSVTEARNSWKDLQQESDGNVIDVDFVAKRLDVAIEQVEAILGEGE
ncbi:MAG: hypothetical protein ACRBDL_02625 [Alphaproteobacteria bacterium]